MRRIGSTVELEGIATATRAGLISRVDTYVASCNNIPYTSSGNPNATLPLCADFVNSTIGRSFTTKILPSAITVLNNQQMHVTVTISFG